MRANQIEFFQAGLKRWLHLHAAAQGGVSLPHSLHGELPGEVGGDRARPNVRVGRVWRHKEGVVHGDAPLMQHLGERAQQPLWLPLLQQGTDSFLSMNR